MAGLSPGAKLLYWILVRFGGKDGRCFPSRELLSEEMAISVRHVARLIKELEKKGLLEHERGRKGRANQYHFLWHERFNTLAQKPGAEMSHHQDTPGQHNGTDLSETRGQIRPTNQSYNHSLNYSINQSRSNDAFNEISSLFERIATAFPDSFVVLTDQMGPRFHDIVLDKLDGHPVKEFEAFIVERFKGGRSPNDEAGPKQWSEFIRWAMDFSREKRGLPPKDWDEDRERITLADGAAILRGRRSSRMTPPPPTRQAVIPVDEDPF